MIQNLPGAAGERRFEGGQLEGNKLATVDAATEVRVRLLTDLARSEAELAQLERDHANLILAAQSTNADDEHDPEGATLAFEREQLVSILARVSRTVTDLRRALNDFDAGRYGVCASCAEPIDPARLEIRPQARLCITCARSSS